MWNTIIGAVLAIGGGVIATLVQSRLVRKIRTEELMAERKLNTNAEAYYNIKKVVSFLKKRADRETLQLIQTQEEWFFKNLFYLPGQFPKKWLTIRYGLGKLLTGKESPEEMANIKKNLHRVAEEAIQEIYKETKSGTLTVEDI
jgi:hypothetical protein